MEITFSMEKFPHSAVGFRWKDRDASRARFFSWSVQGCHTSCVLCPSTPWWHLQSPGGPLAYLLLSSHRTRHKVYTVVWAGGPHRKGRVFSNPSEGGMLFVGIAGTSHLVQRPKWENVWMCRLLSEWQSHSWQLLVGWHHEGMSWECGSPRVTELSWLLFFILFLNQLFW